MQKVHVSSISYTSSVLSTRSSTIVCSQFLIPRELNNLDKSQSDLISAARLSPNDEGIRALLEKVKDRQKELVAKQMKDWKGLAGKSM
jgi:hypothetical protein